MVFRLSGGYGPGADHPEGLGAAEQPPARYGKRQGSRLEPQEAGGAIGMTILPATLSRYFFSRYM
jgi:hypothetical protein